MHRVPGEPAPKPEPKREDEAAPADNFLARYVADLNPSEAAELDELAKLDKLHGDKPTPRK